MLYGHSTGLVAGIGRDRGDLLDLALGTDRAHPLDPDHPMPRRARTPCRPRLHFLDIALGDRPALTPVESFYQRMLAGAAHEARDQAREFLKERSLTAYYDEVVIEGMRLAATDLARGVLDREHFDRVRKALELVIDDLDARKIADPAASEPERTPEGIGTSTTAAGRQGASAPTAKPKTASKAQSSSHSSPAQVLCVAGRGSLDRAVATIAAQLLGKHGLAARIAPRVIGPRSKVETPDAEGASAICVMFLEVRDRPRHIRQTLQRLRQRAPETPLIVGLLNNTGRLIDGEELCETIDADYLVSSLREMLQVCAEIVPRNAQSAPTVVAERGTHRLETIGNAEAK